MREKQIITVVNFPPQQIGKCISEVLKLGLQYQFGNVVLIEPAKKHRMEASYFNPFRLSC